MCLRSSGDRDGASSMWMSNEKREEGPGRHCKPHRRRDIACLRTQVPTNLPFCVEESEEAGASQSPDMEAHPLRSMSSWDTRAAKSLSDPTSSHATKPLIRVLNWLSDQ